MRTLVGLLARGVMWVGFIIIIADAVTELWRDENVILAVLSAIFFPFTIFIWPFYPSGHEAFDHPMWFFFIVSAVAYPISTIIGRLSPIDQPGQF